MTAILNDETYTIDTEDMEETLSQNIRTYAEENNLTVDGDLDSVIASFSETVVAYYKTSIAFPYLSEIASFFRIFDKLMSYILPCVAIFALILLVVIYRLNGYKKNRFFQYLAYSLLSGAISTLVIPIFCYANGFYKRISFTQEYVYRFVVTYFENGLRYFVIAGIVLAVFGILSIITSCVIKSRLKKEHTPHSSHSHSEV
jgi:RsiW-degrading membrane proteinase PrsW (M82 family)